MYTGQQVQVLWNGVYSNNFSVTNGVKQGGIISPDLFCIYIDTLMVTLKKSGLGCYIGEWFLGALVQADDIVLLAPSANAMRNMIAICDVFAKEYHVTFNCNKTKCITFTRPCRK